MQKLTFILFAIVILTTIEKSEGVACSSSSIYWFKVKPGINKTSCVSIASTDLILPNDGPNLGELDISVEAPKGPASTLTFNCDDIGVFICAIAFELSQLELIQDPNFPTDVNRKIWRPKPIEIPLYKCCTKRLHRE